MIYLDTSTALAHLCAEDRYPPDAVWRESLVSSRLLEYELWVRIHARKLTRTHAAATQDLIGRVALLELAPRILARVLDPFPAPIRTLDAIHLASVTFLTEQGHSVELLTYDERMLGAAREMGIVLSPFCS